ncbi:MAG: hypothetical protein ACR2L1_09915 [Pyrinomonadaceae bacterium]
MNIFQDLVDELKEENLIEKIVYDSDSSNLKSASESPLRSVQETVSINKDDPGQFSEIEKPDLESNSDLADSSTDNSEVVLPFNENDFYRRRAMEEVSALQMVERVFCGVEREHLKVVPKPYNDIEVSKVLHDFLQVTKNSDSAENAAAEFKLMQETESWYSALSYRDQNILPAHLRRYCETTHPVLSSQALAALARFYRNSPFSESVRSKFEMVVTRFFSKETDNQQREVLLELDSIAEHLSELYADWSSVSVYSTDDDSELTIISLKFEDFINEAAISASFEELIKTDFFNRLRVFKESIRENFYAPQVTATAIKCNIFVGNRYVELLNLESEKNNAAQIEVKYKFLIDQTVSEATSKTLQLVNLLQKRNGDLDLPVEKRQEKKKTAEAINKRAEVKIDEDSLNKSVKVEQKHSPGIFAVNKWLLAVMLVTVLGSAGLYLWVEFAVPKATTKDVVALEMDGYYFKDYLRVAKISNDTLIGVISPAWNTVDEGKKQEILKDLLAVGKNKGFRSVRLLSNEGITLGYLSMDNITKPDSTNN